MSEVPPPGPMLGIADQRRGSSVVVTVEGDIDLCTGPDLDRHLRDVVRTARSPHPIIVDLSEVAFLGSCGLSVLLRAHQAAEDNGTPLRIVARQRAILRPVQAVGLDTVLRVHPCVEEALAQGG
ncbi:STAS domain-containing protein [Prauserella oleivorans]|uniref:Anti-sigma factor antagonist n=1 Tax=Prauserella oleivorans TaxID=1478153 RepID=A0ABW5WC95_9PSEU